ncbi:MAG: SAM-dependent methyltransferase [Pseudomonadota bacterium]
MIDKRRLSLAVARARARQASVEGADFLLLRLAEDLADRLAVVTRQFAKALLIAPSHRAFLDVVRMRVDGAIDVIDERSMFGETLAAPGTGYDLVVSVGQLHLLDDVPGMLIQIGRVMVPDGLLIAAIPGVGTLDDVRTRLLSAELDLAGGAANRFLPLMDVRSAGALLQRTGFALPVSDVESVTVRYGRFESLVNDLRSMAATNCLLADTSRPLSRTIFDQLRSDWGAAPGKVEVCYDMIWMSGWAKAASQPKPLKPGSANVSLADFLNKK